LLIGVGGIATTGLAGCLLWRRAPRPAGAYDGPLFRFVDDKTQQCGFIDEAGNVRIAPTFASAGAFAEDRAVVRLVSGETAVIDRAGATVFQLRNGGGIGVEQGFADGLLGIASEDGDGTCAYLDRSGAERFRVFSRYPTPASQGRVQFLDRATGLAGYVDLRGQPAVPARYFEARPFSEGLAAVELPGSTANRSGYIDPDGAWVIPPHWDLARPFCSGRANVKGGYIDRTGKMVIPTDDSQLLYDDFSEGFARYEDRRSGSSRDGFIDKDGAITIRPRFAQSLAFSEGLAAAREDGAKWGFIDPAGRWAIAPAFARADSFKHGLAEVAVALEKRDRESRFTPLRVGYINGRGKWIFEWRGERPPPALE
jgi:hypothetical protein